MKNYQKGFIVPILIAIIAVVAIGVGVYFYSQRSANLPDLNTDTSSTTNSTVTTETETSVTPPSNQTTTLKTYSNTKYGFSFKYPSDIQIKEETINQNALRVNLVKDNSTLAKLEINIGNTDFKMRQDLTTTDMTVNGISVHKIIGTPFIGYGFSDGKNDYLFEGTFTSANKTSVETQLNSVISSFTFTNQSISEGQNYRADYNYKTNSDGSSVPTQLVFISPKSERIVVKNDVAVKIDSAIRFQTTGQRGGENISGIIKNPQNSNYLVVVTSDINCVQSGSQLDTCTTIHRFYNFDITGGFLSILYTDNPQTTSGDGTELIPIATQLSKIIVRVHTPGTSSICGGNWVKGASYSYLDLVNISGGLKTFKVPDDLIKRDQAAEAACEAKL